ncbi:UPF0488 protein C8orf33 homolog [Mugil cephalus]|uniref:UPF0488 protein C8orf33 homolog n=1 Tax=Mugil cephalus TaxID=48193 RepID=UPI001FB672D0|nr:UPF0488 protein C8orf33 homolog [Mugil cephalus]
MTEKNLLFIDIEAKSHSSTAPGGVEKPLWARSDNTFRFNFLSDEKTSPVDTVEPAASRTAFTGQGSAFAFNFQIPPVEDMETGETAGSQQCVQEEKPSLLQEADSPTQQSAKSKTKKKKSGKKKATSAEPEQKPSEGSPGGEDAELSAEEQLNRQLDWCIEQLELGLKSQKGTPKQKEEASRALKTLRSSKAPLVKKRQVMRAMSGDYRKKMEEEKSKQFKLIQTEIASAQVKVVSDSPKKSVFHRRAEVKTQTPATEENLQQTEARDKELPLQTGEETSSFVFIPSKEEFCFNFL